MPEIPERTPVGDVFTGVVLHHERPLQERDADAATAHTLLALTALPDTTPMLEGDIIVRYGVRYLGKPHVSIVPGLLALDYGDMLTGHEAFDFIFRRGDRHPRADVLGYRSDGSDEMITLKWLDLALTPEVLVYRDAADTLPFARPEALIAPADAHLPERLRLYLPTFDSFAAWTASLDIPNE